MKREAVIMDEGPYEHTWLKTSWLGNEVFTSVSHDSVGMVQPTDH